MNIKNKETAFSIDYDKDGIPIDVSSEQEDVTITKERELPPNLKTEKVVNTTIIIGQHNPRCRYIWVPGVGWVRVCW